MPELPDVTVYVEALSERLIGRKLTRMRILSPFVLRSLDTPPESFAGRTVAGITRLGKRIVFRFEDDLFMVIHLMIAGRFRWLAPGAKAPGKITLASFEFEDGVLFLTEAGSKKRASIHLLSGAAGLEAHRRGGLEVLETTTEAFARTLRSENHTLKRSLTDPTLFSGIGNAYSDEILHRARLSPITLTSKLTDEEVTRLYHATVETLELWTRRLRAEAVRKFPEKVTAFRKEMAVHGKHGQPCPDCGTPVQRIVYAENETNYCPKCQTGGKLLADRALSRLLGRDWPRSLDEMELMIEKRKG